MDYTDGNRRIFIISIKYAVIPVCVLCVKGISFGARQEFFTIVVEPCMGDKKGTKPE